MAWGGARRHACARELALLKRSASARRSRPVETPEETSVACAYGELGRDPRRGAAPEAPLFRACGRAAANAIKNPNWLFETQNHAKTADCVLERRREAALDAYGEINLVFLGQFCAFMLPVKRVRQSRIDRIESTARRPGPPLVAQKLRSRCDVLPRRLSSFSRGSSGFAVEQIKRR